MTPMSLRMSISEEVPYNELKEDIYCVSFTSLAVLVLLCALIFLML